MAQYYQVPPSVPTLCTSQYSILHQEQLYILKALADEEKRGERLANALETLKSKLENRDATDPQATARKLKQAIKSVRNKIGRCQNREKALSANLAAAIAQMGEMKRCQWRKAWASQCAQMMMSPANGAFGIQSPLAPAITAQMRHMALSPPRYSNMYLNSGGYMPQVPDTPVLHPTVMGYQSSAGSQAGQWHMAQGQAEAVFSSPVSSISPFDLYPFSAISPLTKAKQRPWSWPSVASAYLDVEKEPANEVQTDEKTWLDVSALLMLRALG